MSAAQTHSVTRTQGEASAIGQVIANREPDDALQKLAGARAWYALATQRAQADDAAGALAAARAGLEELGRRYARPLDIDDTQLKIRTIDQAETEGRVGDAARIAVTILETRLELARRLHADALVEEG